MEILQNMRVSLLLEIYGNLLTEKQKVMLSDFYDNNISLTEIALNNSSSRQAVNDLIKRSVKNLEGFEKKLKLLEKYQKLKANVAESLKILESEKPDVKKLKNKISGILEDY